MKGHFKKRGSTWYYWAELESGPDGGRRQVSKGGFRTRKEAEPAFAELRDNVRRGVHVESSKLTLGRYLTDEWLPAIRASVQPHSGRLSCLPARLAQVRGTVLTGLAWPTH